MRDRGAADTDTSTLASRAAQWFADRVRTRGDGYFRRGAVTVTAADDTALDAVVEGSQPYAVSLAYEQGRLVMACECPYVERGEPCKHLWATVRRADEGGWLGTPRAAPRLAFALLLPHTFDDFDDDDLDDLAEPAGPEMLDDDPAWIEQAPVYGEVPVWPPARARAVAQDPPATDWQSVLGRIRHSAMAPDHPTTGRPWPAGQELLYVIDVAQSLARARVTVETWVRRRKLDGTLGTPRPRGVAATEIDSLPDPADRRVLCLLHGAPNPWFYGGYGTAPSSYHLPIAGNDPLVPLLCETGRCRLRLAETTQPGDTPLAWDAGEPWRLLLEVRETRPGGDCEMAGHLVRSGERLSLAEPVMLFAGGLVFERHRVARLEDGGLFPWIALLRRTGRLVVPRGDRARFAAALASLPVLPALELPPALRFETVPGEARPRLRIAAGVPHLFGRPSAALSGTLTFDYGGSDGPVPFGAPGAAAYDPASNRRIARDPAAEQAAFDRVLALGARRRGQDGSSEPGEVLRLKPSLLPAVVRTLVGEGWQVEAEGRLHRQATATSLAVSSGIDWFDVHGRVSFGDASADLPELLEALRRGEGLVPLSDGSVGLLPEAWLRTVGPFAGFGTREGDRLRFRATQIGLIDALLAAAPEATFDAAVARARSAFRDFRGVEPRDPPATFRGTLRPYQRDALGWFEFLGRFGFGGCLADDMGLGKTVQVLALLAEQHPRRRGHARHAPSLVVVPRSLLFNWRQEAERFAPSLRITEHVGSARRREPAAFAGHDVVLTTYGTMRRDVAHLREVRFRWVILDEAQAIKNARTAGAKAVRLLTAEHRLALSGTPIENHVGELWSLFEFLNPGMLGSASAFAAARGGARDLDEGGRQLLARAIRPFVLRRTKAQVAPDLPPRSEQTLHVELDRAERDRYDQLRDHYRRALLPRSGGASAARPNKIQVLEALLRLRQAACHPGLLDQARRGEASAKLEILLAQLAQVRDEGHKALVFSQFTSFLAIVRDRLDRDGVEYAYLDGRTRDRAARVERFQHDPACRLFLVSLKAGGLGLNLTAADYVYLLDPWWNPAVEAQAIDRTHRIGQTRHVFAYRLIARDTVEEKVLELQRTKRGLADALIGADTALIRDLAREDLELLLS